MGAEAVGDDSAMQQLEEWVFDERKAVTFKLLSQSLDLKSSAAQSLLEKFCEKHGDKVHPLYLVSGSGHDSAPVHTVSLVPGSLLQETKAKMAPILSCHVYSVQTALPGSAHELWAAGDERQAELYKELRGGHGANGLVDNRWSSIEGAPRRRPVDLSRAHVALAKAEARPAPASSAPLPKAAEQGPRKGSGDKPSRGGALAGLWTKQAADGAKAQGKSAPQEANAQAGGNDADRKQSKEVSQFFAGAAAKAKPPRAPTAAATTPAAKADGTGTSSKETTPPLQVEAKPAERKKRARVIQEDDGDDDDDAEGAQGADAPQQTAATSKDAMEAESAPAAAEDSAAPPPKPSSAEHLDGNVDGDADGVTESKPEPAAPPTTARTKRVKRSRTFTDERGYMVTEDVWEEVPVEEGDEPVEPPKPKPARKAPLQPLGDVDSPPKKAKADHKGNHKKETNAGNKAQAATKGKSKVPAAGKLTSFFSKKSQ